MVEQAQVLIAGGHRLYREGLRLILSREEDIEVVGETANGSETVAVVGNLEPDVIVLDTETPEMEGTELIQEIRLASPKTKTLILSATQDDSKIYRALMAGAKGYVWKNSTISDLAKAIDAVHAGEIWVERKLMARFLDCLTRADAQCDDPNKHTVKYLTPREREVLHYLAKAWTNKEIANALFISEKTVKAHLNSIFKKLNVTRRVQAILYATNEGLK